MTQLLTGSTALATSVGGFVVAVTVALWAWRGRRIDDHPLCRKCGFNLSGKPPDSTICSECGTDVSAARAIRIGNRQARRRPLAAAMPLLLLSGGWLGVLTFGHLRNVQWIQHEPFSWLIRDARSADPTANGPAIAELIRRLDANELDREHLQTSLEAALAHQADVDTPWIQSWGTLVEKARKQGKVSDESWRRYAEGAATIICRVRPELRRGDVLPVELRVVENRRDQATFELIVFSDGAWIGTAKMSQGPPDYEIGFQYPEGCMAGRLVSWQVDPGGIAALADGPQEVLIRGRVCLNRDERGREEAELVSMAQGRKIDIRAKTIISNTPIPLATVNPALRDAVKNSLQLKVLRPDPSIIEVQVRSVTCPVHLSFKALAALDGHWRESKNQLQHSAPRDWSRLQFDDVKEPVPGFVDVRLVPDAAGAAETLDLLHIWPEEILFEHVPVEAK